MESFLDITSADLPETLYHYTSQQGLMGIVGNRSLWMTDILYLNDAQEFGYALSLLEKEIEPIWEDLDDFDNFKVIHAKKSHVTQEEIKNRYKDSCLFLENIRQILRAFYKAGETSTYVFSMSKKKDSLSQWRGYCNTGAGFCIGFDTAKLKEIVDEKNLSLFQCVYDMNLQTNLIREILLQSMEKLSTVELNETVSEFLLKFMRIAPIMKDPSFQEEEEWRIVLHPPRTSIGELRFREGKSMLIPYIETTLQKQLICEIVIGPTPHEDLSRQSLKALMHSNGINCKLSKSDIPYRSW
ncbi:MAG: DUF2971 domain-containing protein [Thermodesulfovibrionales bacterium]